MRVGLCAGLALALCSSAVAQELEVVSVSPAANALAVPVNTTITLNFDRAIDTSTITATDALMVFGRSSGVVPGSYSFLNGNTTVRFTPTAPIAAGQLVTVTLSNEVTDTVAVGIRSGGYSFQFWTAAQPTNTTYQLIDVMDTGTPSTPYGVASADLDEDSFIDLLCINEDSDDIRIFINKADSTGAVFPYATPPSGSGSTPSPSETADFDRDGNTDICLANVGGDSVSVFLGNGDGTLDTHTEYAVGDDPRGIAVIDINGDGYMDIVNTNRTANSISILTNDQTGHFGAPNFIETGGDQEWGIATGDMDNDGLLDVVVGCRGSSNVAVLLNNGAGGLVAAGPLTSAGGGPWKMRVGDLNNDGLLDVAIANRTQGNGAFALNTGGGILGAPATVAAPDSPVAIDLGDLDGDGDLDTVISRVFGDWNVYKNNGSGVFTFDQTLDAFQGASCATLIDLDNNQTLDLALVDEFDDSMQLFRSSPAGPPPPPPPPPPGAGLPGVGLLAGVMLVVGVTVALRRRPNDHAAS